MAIAAGIAGLIPESGMKPQNASEMDMHLTGACFYEASICGKQQPHT